MNLNYAIEIEKAHGEWVAVIPRLSRIAFCGSGETIQQALEDLNINKENYFKACLDQGRKILEPAADDKYILNIPISGKIYKNVVKSAENNNELPDEYVARILESIFVSKKELVK